MRLVSTHRVKRANAKNIWLGVVLLGLLIIMAFWLVRFPLSLQAFESAFPVNTQSLPQELVPLDGIGQVAAGNSHTCALTIAGGVKCWGRNYFGQLGNGSTVDTTTPVDVTGLGSGMTSIALGGSHTCSLTTAGGVKCWGSNSSGQLGDGTTGNKSTPVGVVGLGSDVTIIGDGGSTAHTCAVTTTGGAKCWGENVFGQLGNGNKIMQSSPVDVMGLGNSVTTITAGSRHTCAITTTGGAKCWGSNEFGQLGDGTSGYGEYSSTPVDVMGLGSAVAGIAMGRYHTCALLTTGGVQCWGYNGFGQLGNGSTTDTTSPVDVVGLSSGVVAITAGRYYTCALSTIEGVKCWGSNSSGQLGDGSTVGRLTPVNAVGLENGVTAVIAGDQHTCALTSTGRARCWGNNENGQLGDGTTINKSTPVDVLVPALATPTHTPTSTLTPTPTVTPAPTATSTSTPTSPSPIVFVHGWNGLNGSCGQVKPDDYFEKVDDELRKSGYDVSYAELESSFCDTPALTQNVQPLKNAIAQAKQKSGGQKVIVIAHSMGGLVSREYIEGDNYQRDVSVLFTFGSPHTGIPGDVLVFLSNGVSLGKFCEWQTAVCDFSTLGMALFNQTYASRRAGVEYHAISGDAPFWSRNPLGKAMDVLIPGADDGIVPLSSGVGLPGPVDRAQSDEVHSKTFGSHSYFIRDDGPSASYSDCLKPILVDKTTNTCTSGARTIAASELTPALAVHVPFEFGTLQEGQSVTRSIELASGAALFAAQWQTGTVAVRLLSPNGQTIDPSFAIARPSEVSYDTDGLSASYYLTGTVAGTWRLVLQADTVPAQGNAYTTFAAFDSDIALAGHTDRTWYTPGATATITATLSGSPASAVITATILRTDGFTDTVSLNQTGTGVFEGSYTVPSASGYTEVRFAASGTTAANAPFERGISQAIQIASSSVAKLSGSYADRGEDSAGDGQYEALAVDVSVTANVSGTFAVAAHLVSAADGALIAKTATSASLITGTHTLNLRFDGNTIRAAKQGGPYRVTSVLLIDNRGAALPVQEAADVWTTAAYKWDEFGTPLQLYLPSITR